jgi:hypothetical protein
VPKYQAVFVRYIGNSKKIKIIDGKPHRKRRGKWVEIPWEWVGHVCHPQTQRKRRKRAQDKHIGRKRRRRRSRERLRQ